MKKNIFFLFTLFLLISCKTGSNSDTHYINSKDAKVYKLQLNPASGTKYYFDIHNESLVTLEVNDKKTVNLNKSDVGVNYAVNKDTTGDYIFSVTYDKIHLYSKNGDKESDMDAANAAGSIDPIEKMLVILKDASISATVSPGGEVKAVKGYKEIGDKMMAAFNASDSYVRNLAKGQMELVIGDGIIKKNMAQLFEIFPDSAVHVGDRWKLISAQKGQFNLKVRNTYVLRSINDGVATIHVEGEIKSDSTSSSLMGYDVTSDLTGQQEGDYTMESATGMLMSCKLNTTIEGTVQLMGRDVPVSIEKKSEFNRQ